MSATSATIGMAAVLTLTVLAAMVAAAPLSVEKRQAEVAVPVAQMHNVRQKKNFLNALADPDKAHFYR